MKEKTSQGSEIKTYGIAADNYKLQRFESELKKCGYTDYTIEPFHKKEHISIIKVKAPIIKFFEIKNICMGVELFFKRSN